MQERDNEAGPSRSPRVGSYEAGEQSAEESAEDGYSNQYPREEPRRVEVDPATRDQLLAIYFTHVHVRWQISAEPCAPG